MKIKSFIFLSILLLPLFGMAQREFITAEGDTMKRYVFMLLEAGDNRTHDSIQVVNIQKGHMDHLNMMATTGKLIMAGPFEKGDPYRGLLIFDLETIEEAEKMERDDPAVVAGRLKMKTFYWWSAKGVTLK